MKLKLVPKFKGEYKEYIPKGSDGEELDFEVIDAASNRRPWPGDPNIDQWPLTPPKLEVLKEGLRLIVYRYGVQYTLGRNDQGKVMMDEDWWYGDRNGMPSTLYTLNNWADGIEDLKGHAWLFGFELKEVKGLTDIDPN